MAVLTVLEEAPDGGYSARAVGEPIVTEADSLEELREAIKDALLCHFDEEQDLPRLVRLRLVS